MATEKQTTQKAVEHPLEQVFDIEPGTTIIESHERTTDLVVHEQFDNKDKEIEEQFQEIYDAAMEAFDQQLDDARATEPKYRARQQEVAANFLNAALSAAREKRSQKEHSDKMAVAKEKAKTPGTVNQNLIVSNQNELLKHILGDKGDSSNET